MRRKVYHYVGVSFELQVKRDIDPFSAIFSEWILKICNNFSLIVLYSGQIRKLNFYMRGGGKPADELHLLCDQARSKYFRIHKMKISFEVHCWLFPQFNRV
jgi:hypothetical protein